MSISRSTNALSNSLMYEPMFSIQYNAINNYNAGNATLMLTCRHFYAGDQRLEFTLNIELIYRIIKISLKNCVHQKRNKNFRDPHKFFIAQNFSHNQQKIMCIIHT